MPIDERFAHSTAEQSTAWGEHVNREKRNKMRYLTTIVGSISDGSSERRGMRRDVSEVNSRLKGLETTLTERARDNREIVSEIRILKKKLLKHWAASNLSSVGSSASGNSTASSLTASSCPPLISSKLKPQNAKSNSTYQSIQRPGTATRPSSSVRSHRSLRPSSAGTPPYPRIKQGTPRISKT